MSAGIKKSGRFSQLSTIEALLSVVVPMAAFVAFVFWMVGQPLKRPVPGEVAIELRESSQVIVAAAVFCIVALAFCGTVLLRRRLEKLTLAALMTGMIGIAVGGIGAANAAKSVVTFTPTGVTVSVPPWFGGATQTKLIFAQIAWVRARETVRWERDWVPRRFIMSLMMGEKTGWQRIATDEYFITMKGGGETEVTLTGLPPGAWREIFTALRAAGVAIKPIERIVLSQPPD